MGVREEERGLATVFDMVAEQGDALVQLTSGYFALYAPWQDRALRNGMNWQIVAASPKVHSRLDGVSHGSLIGLM